LQAGVVALVPGPGQVGGDPDGHAPVVAAAHPGEQLGVQVGPVVGPGGVDLVDRPAQGVGDLAGPGLGVVEVAQQVGQALLDPGQGGVVAAEVVADQHPTEVVEDRTTR